MGVGAKGHMNGGAQGVFREVKLLRVINDGYVSGHIVQTREHTTPRVNPGAFPGGTVVKNPPANAGHTGSGPGLGRSHMPRSN